MSNKILVTDSLFIFDEHVKQLETAGYEIERLDKPAATEAELCEAVKGKLGYILGGIEKITDKVIESADELKAIVFTGTDYKGFIPGWQVATSRGIAIADTPHANAEAVAEWAFATSLAMNRNLFDLGKTGTQTFQTTRGIDSLHIGIVGLGHIGTALADHFNKVGAASVRYWSRQKKESNYEYAELSELLTTSDIVCVCVSTEAGAGWLDKEKLASIKDSAIVTCLADSVLDENALVAELHAKRLRAFLDWTPKDEAYQDLPLNVFYCSNESTAYNTQSANQVASDWATQSMINLLQTGQDSHRVN